MDNTIIDKDIVIAYHCEGGETFEDNGSIHLSMETLTNNKPLFLALNKEDWLPMHLDLSEYRLYEIKYKQPDVIMMYTDFNKYHHALHSSLDRLKKEGCELIMLTHNKQNELLECVLLNPKDSVVSITQIKSFICKNMGVTMNVKLYR